MSLLVCIAVFLLLFCLFEEFRFLIIANVAVIALALIAMFVVLPILILEELQTRWKRRKIL
jgi:hypothetical protein